METVLYITQSSRIKVSASDALESYPGHFLEGLSHPPTVTVSAYSIAPAEWVKELYYCYLTHIRYKAVITLSKVISPKLNVALWLKFELSVVKTRWLAITPQRHPFPC